MSQRPAAFVIKAAIVDGHAKTFIFSKQKTMYGGKLIAVGDELFIFASENEGGQGLIARGTVTAMRAVPKNLKLERQTPCISIEVKWRAKAKRPLGRRELKTFNNWNDGRSETELNFKFYRQATNKVAGITADCAAFLGRYF